MLELRLTMGLHAAGHQIASSYCVRKGLIRKAHLAHNLRKWNAKFPGGRLAGAVPETLVMVLDDIDYFEEALSDVYEAGQPSSQHVCCNCRTRFESESPGKRFAQHVA